MCDEGCVGVLCGTQFRIRGSTRSRDAAAIFAALTGYVTVRTSCRSKTMHRTLSSIEICMSFSSLSCRSDLRTDALPSLLGGRHLQTHNRCMSIMPFSTCMYASTRIVNLQHSNLECRFMHFPHLGTEWIEIGKTNTFAGDRILLQLEDCAACSCYPRSGWHQRQRVEAASGRFRMGVDHRCAVDILAHNPTFLNYSPSVLRFCSA